MTASRNYQDKIDYYSYQVNKAISNLDTGKLDFYTNKLKYFMGRQAAHIKANTTADGFYRVG